jgi:ferric-dicitrate binding protein FerR (iron transport regulator)
VNHKKIDPSLRRLIDAAVSGRATEEELQRLDDWLARDDQALKAFLSYCQLEADLFFHGRATLAGKRVLAGIEQLDLAAVADHTKQVASPRSSNRRRRNVRWFASLAAAVALVGLFTWWSTSWNEILAERQPQPIARFDGGEDAEWLSETAPAIGQTFVEGDSVYLTKGHARISMASGAELLLRGPCFVTLATADSVRLEEGVVTAEVAEWGRGFTVLTESLSVVDLGTKFAVSAGADGVAEAHVLDGQVRVKPLTKSTTEGRSMLLSGGEAIRVESDRKPATRLAADTERFDAEMGDQLPFRPIPIQNTGRGLVAGDEDPNWRVTVGPESALPKGPQFAVVANADGRYLGNDASRSQWISITNPVRPGIRPNSLCTFETTFDLTGYDLSTVMVAAQVLADNGVIAVRINGEPVPMKPWHLNERDQTFNKFQTIEIKSGFTRGRNKVEFDVWNGIDSYRPAEPNPMALRVEWQAFGRPVQLAKSSTAMIH